MWDYLELSLLVERLFLSILNFFLPYLEGLKIILTFVELNQLLNRYKLKPW